MSHGIRNALSKHAHSVAPVLDCNPEGFISRLRRHCLEHPHKLAVSSSLGPIEYGELGFLQKQFGAAISESGERQRVFIMGARSTDLIGCVVAALMLGSSLRSLTLHIRTST